MSLNIDTSILRSTFQEEGYIYCIANQNYEGWIKVGMTKNPEERLKQYNMYAPTDSFYYLQKQKVPHYRLSERHLIQTFSKYSCSESFDNENTREEWFKTTPTKAEKYFLEVTNTIEEYVHSYCIKEVNKIREKKHYHANKLEEYALKREEAKRKKSESAKKIYLEKKQEQEKKWVEEQKHVDPLLDAAINRIEKNRRVQQNIIALQKHRRKTKPLIKLLHNLELLNAF